MHCFHRVAHLGEWGGGDGRTDGSCAMGQMEIATFDHFQHMLLPRIAALCETGWSYGNKDYDDFAHRMHILRGLYDYKGFVYAPYFFNGIE